MDFALSRVRKSRWIGFGLAVALVAGSAFFRFAPHHAGPPRDQWRVPLPSERLWTVRSIVRDLGRFVAFGSGRDSDLWAEDAITVTATAFEDGKDWYRVHVRYGAGREWETELALSGSAMDTEAYLPFTHELLRRARVGTPVQPVPVAHFSPVGMLTIPRPEIFQRENTRISEWLQSSPLDAQAHAEAALLLATLAWRESAGVFSDPRDLCHRATAHLVLAQLEAQGQEPGDAAMVAELMLGLTGKTDADHEARLRKMAARAVSAPELNPWISTAEMWLGGDGRAVAAAENPSLLERIELFRATCRTQGTAAASLQLGKREFEDVSDWTRIVFEHECSAADGRRFCKYALPFETEEAVRVFPELAGQPIQSPAFAKVLNSAIEPAVSGEGPANARVSVIDAGLWAHYLQRHLCHVICRTGDHLRATAAYPETATAFCLSAAAVYRHLKLVPLAAVASGDREWLNRATPAVAALLKQHPDWVAEGVWTRFVRDAPAEMTRDLPSVAQWIGPDRATSPQ